MEKGGANVLLQMMSNSRISKKQKILSCLLIATLALINKCFCQTKPPAVPEVFNCFGSPVSYPGGNDSMMAFLHRNLRAPKGNCEGAKVIVRLEFTKKGKIIKSTIVRGLCDEFNKEVVRVVSKMPLWNVEKNMHPSDRIIYMLAVRLDTE